MRGEIEDYMKAIEESMRNSLKHINRVNIKYFFFIKKNITKKIMKKKALFFEIQRRNNFKKRMNFR